MRRIALVALAIGILAPLFASAPAHAQATRTWVSGVGDDANPCSRTAPCKTFAGAISKTATAGEINCLDPGGFGTVTITKSITLNCNATLGSVLASGVPGVTINAANGIVALRGIQIQGIQGGTSVAGTIGVRILAAATVSIEDCVITQFAQQGISDARGGGNNRLNIRNTVISNNVSTGIGLGAGGTNNTVEIDNVSSINNLFGVSAGVGNNAVVRRSVFSGNGTGVEGDSGANVVVNDSAISGNGTGVQSTSSVRISNSDIAFNATGFSGVATTYGNNRIFSNTAPGTTPGAAGGPSSDLGEQ
jgi:hypothetical protein